MTSTNWRKLIGVVLMALGIQILALHAAGVPIEKMVIPLGAEIATATGSFLIDPKRTTERLLSVFENQAAPHLHESGENGGDPKMTPTKGGSSE